MSSNALVLSQISQNEIAQQWNEFSRYVVGRLHARPDDAEDVVQGAFVRILRKNKEVLTTEELKILLYDACRRETNRFRKRRKQKNNPAELTEDIPRDHRAFKDIERDEEFAQLTAAIDRLDEADRELVLLRYFSDIKPSDISQLTKLETHTVYKRLEKARGQLRKLLKHASADLVTATEEEERLIEWVGQAFNNLDGRTRNLSGSLVELSDRLGGVEALSQVFQKFNEMISGTNEMSRKSGILSNKIKLTLERVAG